MWTLSDLLVITNEQCPNVEGLNYSEGPITGWASCHDVAATVLDFAADEDVSQQYLPRCSSLSLKPFLTGSKK